MKNSITPPAAVVMPETQNPGLYVWRASYNQPAIGGPKKDEMPWKSSSNPNAFGKQSSPTRSTTMTEVNPAYPPVVNPYIHT